MRFTKMHGAGNDFVVLDLRDGDLGRLVDLASSRGEDEDVAAC